MRIARFRTVAGQQFIEGTMASEGAFIGGETAEAEAATLASDAASLAGIVGEAVEAVVDDNDPWDGIGTLLALPEPPAPEPSPPTMEERLAALEARLARKG